MLTNWTKTYLFTFSFQKRPLFPCGINARMHTCKNPFIITLRVNKEIAFLITETKTNLPGRETHEHTAPMLSGKNSKEDKENQGANIFDNIYSKNWTTREKVSVWDCVKNNIYRCFIKMKLKIWNIFHLKYRFFQMGAKTYGVDRICIQIKMQKEKVNANMHWHPYALTVLQMSIYIVLEYYAGICCHIYSWINNAQNQPVDMHANSE